MREDWIECAFEDIIKYSKGKKPKNLTKVKSDGFLPYINIKAFEKNIIEEYSNDLNVNLCKDGDLVMVWDGARAGYSGIAQKGIVGSTLMKIEPTNDKYISKKFIFYFLKSLFKFLNTNTKGVGIPHVEPNNLWKKEFQLPPTPEQRAIVKKMEQLFSALDASIADLKKAQGQLKIYRQAVLKKAFEGTFSWIELDNLIIKIEAGKSFRCKEVPPNIDEIGVLKVSSVTWGEFNETESKTVVDSSKINENYFVRKGDFLLSRANTIDLVGNAVIVKKISKTLMLSDKTLRLVLKSSLDKNFLLYFLRTNDGRNQVMKLSTGNQESMRNISQNSIRKIILPLPSTEEQNQIVKEIESRLSVCDAVEQQIKTSLDKAEALRQSILKKAFAGALLTQVELEACRKEPDYEPASVLLEKIKAEKQNDKKKTEKEKAIIPAKPAVAAPGKISTDIQAGLIAKVIRLHEDNPKHHKLLTHIKCEKLSHLVEYHLQIPLGRQPVKDAAGPDDYKRLKAVEHRAKMAGYFSVQKNKIGYTYVSGKGIGKAITQFEKNLSEEQKQQVDQLLHLFLTFDLEQAEIVATVYAAWNNLLILGKNKPKNQEIVQEARYNWSDRKLGLEEHRFYKAIEWMQKDTVNLVPTGYGTLVDFPKKKK